MFRFAVAIAITAVAFPCTSAHAQRRGKCARGADLQRRHYSAGHPHYRSLYPSSSLGLSIGVGGYPGFGYSSFGYSSFGYGEPYPFYGYRSGYDYFGAPNFEPPDLLRDPYFRARHKFDSHFPGRYRTPLEFRSTVPVVSYPSRGPSIAYPDADPVPAAVSAEDLPGQLQVACEKLSNSLAILPGGKPWREYLAPHRISQLIAAGDSNQLHQLLSRYDAVLGDSKLRSIEMSRGFSETRDLLRQYLNQLTEPIEASEEEPVVETLPLPEPALDQD